MQKTGATDATGATHYVMLINRSSQGVPVSRVDAKLERQRWCQPSDISSKVPACRLSHLVLRRQQTRHGDGRFTDISKQCRLVASVAGGKVMGGEYTIPASLATMILRSRSQKNT